MGGERREMGIPQHNSNPMTAADFFAFSASRPEGEHWELIAGEPVLSPSANFTHQTIVGNLIFALRLFQAGTWIAVPGIGVKISDANIPIPDVLVRPATPLDDWKCDDAIVAFEVLSPSSADHDLRWKRKAYARLASVQHYVIVAQDAAEIVVYDRWNNFAERNIEGIEQMLCLSALGVEIALADIYRNTGIRT
jgi:Uma2 family endonuclease